MSAGDMNSWTQNLCPYADTNPCTRQTHDSSSLTGVYVENSLSFKSWWVFLHFSQHPSHCLNGVDPVKKDASAPSNVDHIHCTQKSKKIKINECISRESLKHWPRCMVQLEEASCSGLMKKHSNYYCSCLEVNSRLGKLNMYTKPSMEGKDRVKGTGNVHFIGTHTSLPPKTGCSPCQCNHQWHRSVLLSPPLWCQPLTAPCSVFCTSDLHPVELTQHEPCNRPGL